MKLANASFGFKSPDPVLPEVFDEPCSESASQNTTRKSSLSSAADRRSTRVKLDWDHYVNSRLDDFHQR